MHTDSPLSAPHTVDLNLTGNCNLRCSFCWGPPHEQGTLLDTTQWCGLVKELKARGTCSIVITGGEPLLRRDLPAICAAIRAQQLQLTLSTNGILLPALGPHILPHINELGLPIDGTCEADNAAMRVSPSGRSHLAAVWRAIDTLLAGDWPIELTIRTVISRQNAHAILAIGALVARINWPLLRWKLYRFVPISYGAAVRPEFWIEHDRFAAIVAQARQAYPNLQIDTLGHAEREGRYLHIMPNGDAITPTAQHEEIALGNALADLDGVLAQLMGRLNRQHHGQHGQPLAALALGA